MAVIMPTGISVGAIIVRANVSHKMRKLAPTYFPINPDSPESGLNSP